MTVWGSPDLDRKPTANHRISTLQTNLGNGVGDNPTWIFEVQAGSGDIRKFYSSAENTGDWSFQGDDGIFLRFRKGDLEMKIAHRDSWSSDTLVYMLEEY